MNIDELKRECLSLPGVTFDFPFDDETLVFRVGGRMFAHIGINNEPVRVNLKCDPDLAIDLRRSSPSVFPGYDTYKRHWNTVVCDGASWVRRVLDLRPSSETIVTLLRAGTRRDEVVRGHSPRLTDQLWEDPLVTRPSRDQRGIVD